MTCTRLGRTVGTEDEICGDNAESKIRRQVSEMILDCVHQRRRPRRYNGDSSALGAGLNSFDSNRCTQSSIITQSGAEAARLAHTQKATGASPVSATNCARL